MSKVKFLPAIEPKRNPCLHCPDPPAQAPMDKIIAVGFGSAVVTCDGKLIADGERAKDYIRFKDAEKWAKKDPNHDWRVQLHGPLHGETYQRQGPGKWVCIEQNEGFA